MTEKAEQSTDVASGQIEDEQPVKVYAYRYVCMFLFFFTALMNCLAPNTFVAVAEPTTQLYQIDRLAVNLNSLAYTIMQPLITFPASYILDQVGLKVGTNVALLFMAIGYGLRLLINVQFWIFVVGTYITALGFIFIMNSPTKFASNWFPVSQIAVVNAVVMFALLASDALGVFFPVLFLGDAFTKDEMFTLVLYETCIVVGMHLLMFVFFRGKPPTPANYSSQVKKESYVQSLKHLARNKNYLTLMGSVVLVWGVVSAFFATIGWEVGAYGLDSNEIGMIVIWSNACGIFGCIFAGAFIEKTKKYKLTAIMCLLLGVASLVIFMICLEFDSPRAALYAMSALTGLFLFPYITTIVELATEIAFPIGQATSGGSLLAAGQLLGFALGISMQFLLDGKTKLYSRIGAGVYVGLMLLGAVIMCRVKEDLKKHQMEKQEQQKNRLLGTSVNQSDVLGVN